jgi:HEPN domain-containing protein
MKENEINYVKWQNKSLEFYLAARRCHRSELYGAAAFLAIQALETLLKATLVYWDKSFVPEAAGHAIKKMVRMVRNKVRGHASFDIPTYFSFEQRYQSVSRYPKDRKGIGTPSTFIADLDKVFVELISMVPFQFNTELLDVANGRWPHRLACLRRSNSQLKRLRKIIGAKLTRKT